MNDKESEVMLLVMSQPEVESYSDSINNITSVVVHLEDCNALNTMILDVKSTPGNLVKDIFKIKHDSIDKDGNLDAEVANKLITFVAHYLDSVDLVIFSGSGRKGFNNAIAKAFEDYFEIESASKSDYEDLVEYSVDRNLYNRANCNLYTSVLLSLNE